MVPYRSREEPRAPREAPKAGLVADMVRQFADTFAFVRELVQNGIDAGATSLHVTVDRTSDGVTSVRVADDGCGMTLDIIESALLVLFRSTKDEDSTKIGKYGVGFMSVLAIDPSEVTIDTWRGAEAHRVRLFADHSFEIEQAAPRDGHGTVVSIAKVVAAEEFDDFWQDVAGALHRWCRHAEVPIHFVLIDGVSPEPRRARADRPFGVRAAVSVYNKYSDGMEIAVGPIAGSGELPSAGSAEDDPAPFAGFYNRGLTLHETRFAPHGDLSDVRVKVKSAALCHTLSRDDVRRDNAYHLGILRARQLVSGELREAAFRALNAEIERAVEGEAPKLGALLDVVLARPISADADEIQLPLAHAVEGRRTLTAREASAAIAARLGSERAIVLVANQTSAQTAALAQHGVPVVWLGDGAVARAIERGGRLCAPAETECHVGVELSGDERMANDDVLCTLLGEALARTGIGRVTIGRFLGAGPPLAVLVRKPRAGASTHVVPTTAGILMQDRWPKGALLLLRAEAEAVDCARRATSPAIGAHLLARYLLLAGPGVTARASEELAVRALEQIR